MPEFTRFFIGQPTGEKTMIISVILFALAAVGGVVLAVRRLRGQPLPGSIAAAHGVAAAVALVTLIGAFAGASAPRGSIVAATVLFVVAATGGFALLSFHLRGRTLPLPLMLLHGGIAVAGFVALLVAVLA